MVRLAGNDLLGELPEALIPDAQSIVLRPVSVNDHSVCCAVEDSAFTNPAHRASPEKVFRSITAPGHSAMLARFVEGRV